MMTRQPVRYVLNRAEEMQVSAPRSAELWEIRDALAEDGRLLAREFKGWFDAGAYTRLTSYGVVKCTGHLPGPYTIPAVKSDIYCVFTHRTPSTAMRGFGVLGVDFAIERQMDKGARAVGLGPLEFRLINAYRDGDMKVTRRSASNTALVECIQVAAQKADYPLEMHYHKMSSKTGSIHTEIPETVTETAVLPAGHTTVAKTNKAQGLTEDVSEQTNPATRRPLKKASVLQGSTSTDRLGASALSGRSDSTSGDIQPAPQTQTPKIETQPPNSKSRYSRYSASIRRR
jgi:hypothetical protein